MDYIASTGMLIGIYVILASSYNLIIGYGGLNTVAHPIFFALGAYTTALLGIHTGLPALPCVVAGVGVAVLASVVARAHHAAHLGRLPADRQPGIPARIAAIGKQFRVHRRSGGTVGHSLHDNRRGPRPSVPGDLRGAGRERGAGDPRG